MFNALEVLNCTPELQRDWFTQLAHGNCFVGHLFFFEIVHCLRLDDIRFLLRIHGIRMSSVALPGWLASDMRAHVSFVHGVSGWSHENTGVHSDCKAVRCLDGTWRLLLALLVRSGACTSRSLPAFFSDIGWNSRFVCVCVSPSGFRRCPA